MTVDDRTDWDKRAVTYDSIQWVHHPGLLAWTAGHAARAIREAPAWDDAMSGGKLVCEVGCGTGALTLDLAVRGVSGVACDVSAEMLDRASARLRVVSSPPSFHRVEPTSLPPGAPFAGVVSRMVLHHAPCHPREQLSRWLDAVVPGCAVVVAEGPPPASDPRHPARELYERAMGVKEFGRWVFTAADVAEWLLDLGCDGVTVAERWTTGNSTRQWALGGGMDPVAAGDLVREHREAIERSSQAREAYRAEVTGDGDVLLRYRHCVVAGWRG